MITQAKRNPPEVTTGVVRWAVKGVVYLLAAGLILYLVSGRWDWTWAGAYLGLVAGVQVLTGLIFIPTNPELLAERSQVQPGTKSWDPLLVSILAIFGPLAIWIISALDVRLGWTSPWPDGVHLTGLFLAMAGALLTLWAMLVNRFFAATVRIQTDRGHTVISHGPYRIVRHPGYVGALVFTLAATLLLGSGWAFIPAVAVGIATIVRTRLEDQTLQVELTGYQEYAQRVPYRLLPGIW